MINCTGNIHKGIYNCFGDYDKTMCFDCQFNSSSEAEIKTKNFQSYKDRINILYEYLIGNGLPDGVHCSMPKLRPTMAFNIIWLLQEVLHVLPDNIEQCQTCKELYDTDSEGIHLDDQCDLIAESGKKKTMPKKYWGHYCGACIPDIDFEVK